MLPDCRQVGMLVGQIEEIREVADAQWPQVLELVDCESVCTGGSGILAEADCRADLGGGEGSCSVVQGKPLVNMTDKLFGRAVMSVRVWSGELFHKSVGNLAAIGICLA